MHVVPLHVDGALGDHHVLAARSAGEFGGVDEVHLELGDSHPTRRVLVPILT